MMDSIDVSRWLPHKAPMLMLSAACQYNEDTLHGHCQIKPDNPLLEQHRFPCAGGIEVFAQAAGVLFGLRNVKKELYSNVDQKADRIDHASGLPGAVIQLKNFELGTAIVNIGDELIISAQFLGGSELAGMITGDVYLDDQLVFKGTLMIAIFKAKDDAA